MKVFKKASVLMIISVMLIQLISMAGCQSVSTSSETTTTTSQTTSTTTTAKPTETEDPREDAGNGLKVPLTTGGEVIRLATLDNDVADLSFNDGTFPIIERIEERTGIKIQFEVNRTDYHTVMQTRIAAATDLPDIFLTPSGTDPIKLGSDGIVLRLNDYIDQYAPNTKKLMEDIPEVRKAVSTPDGSIYGIPLQVAPDQNQFNCLGLGYRLDWLKKLDLSEPQTMEDWYTMLKAFKDQDPNGNGKQDEIPFVAAGPWALNEFTGAYGLTPYSYWFAADASGKVSYTLLSPKLKDYLTEMNRWWREELIDQGMLTPHGDKADAYVVGDIGGSTSAWAQRFDQFTQQLQATGITGQWVFALPPKGPHGDQAYQVFSTIAAGNQYAIAASSEHKELAMQLLDYIFASDEGKMLYNFGIEGLSYTMVDGKPQLTDMILKSDKYANPNQAMAALGASRLPRVMLFDRLNQVAAGFTGEDSMNRLNAASKFYQPVFPEVMSSKEESDLFTQKMTDIDTYQTEMIQKFIIGTEPLDNFDDFISTLQSLGIDELVALKQAQYDRWMSN